MKKLLYLSSAFLLALALAVGCKKGQMDKPLQLIAAKTTIKLVETDSLVLLGAEGDSVKWTVTPSGLMFHNSNKATVLFYQAGTYVVTATDPGHAPLSKTITVLNENYYPTTPNNPPPPPVSHDTSKFIPVTGDLVITPKVFREPNTDSLDLILNIKSSNTYPCGNSSFYLTQSQTNNNFVIDIPNILQPSNYSCTRPNTQIQRSIAFYPQVNSPVVVGTSYPLTITIGSTKYTGSIVFAKDYADITWPYTSGVTFTSTHATL
ncbi:MAG TPA: hypothetical protein VNW51_09215 [Mucilaginibacter sp.]|jgi:hypothetical protein|nr:hypothetical protein [Mucilaginibacter sp.]